MNKFEFFQLYKEPEWPKRRDEIFKRDEWRCRCCGRDDIMLNAHHLYYHEDATPWDVPDDALITLCVVCHKIVHLLKDKHGNGFLEWNIWAAEWRGKYYFLKLVKFKTRRYSIMRIDAEHAAIYGVLEAVELQSGDLGNELLTEGQNKELVRMLINEFCKVHMKFKEQIMQHESFSKANALIKQAMMRERKVFEDGRT